MRDRSHLTRRVASLVQAIQNVHRVPVWVSSGMATIVLGLAVWLASSHGILAQVNWRWAVAAVVLAFFQLPLGILEFQATAKLSGAEVDTKKAFGVTVVGAALNMLPLPGGMAVRLAALKGDGVAVSTSALAMAILASLWIAVGAFAASIAATLLGVWTLASILGFLAFTFAAGALLLTSNSSKSFGQLLRPTLIEAAFVVLAAVRIWVSFRAISSPVHVGPSVVMASSSAFASTFRWIPGAWGVWEGLATLLAVAVSVPASTAFVAAVVTRMCAYISTGVALLLHAGIRSRSAGP